MLQQEGVAGLLEALALHPGTHADVQARARLSLHLLGALQQDQSTGPGPPLREGGGPPPPPGLPQSD